MRRITLFILLTTIFASCNQTPYKSEIAELDKLIVKLDSAKTILQNVDTNGYRDYAKRFQTNLNFVTNHFRNSEDTIGRDLALFMADYRSLKKPYMNFHGTYDQASRELEFTEKQLLTLKHDLQYNLLDSTVVRKMFKRELEETNEIVDLVKRIDFGDDYTRELASKLEPKMDSVIVALKNQK